MNYMLFVLCICIDAVTAVMYDGNNMPMSSFHSRLSPGFCVNAYLLQKMEILPSCNNAEGGIPFGKTFSYIHTAAGSMRNLWWIRYPRSARGVPRNGVYVRAVY
jgi:hypothetical protein